jgi:uncharacterized integral membrane protein
MLPLVLGLIIGGASVVFVLQNITPITVTFFIWQVSGSLSVVLLATLLTGMIMSALILLPGILKAGWGMRQLIKRNKKLEDDLMLNSRPTASKVTEPMPVEYEPEIDIDEELNKKENA